MKEAPPVGEQQRRLGFALLAAVRRFQKQNRRRQQAIGRNQQIFLFDVTKQELPIDDPIAAMGHMPHPAGQLEGMPDDLVEHARRHQHRRGFNRMQHALQFGGGHGGSWNADALTTTM